MNALTRLDRFESMFPERLRRWARPMPLFDDAMYGCGSDNIAAVPQRLREST